MSRCALRFRPVVALASLFAFAHVGAAPVIEVKPGLWATDTEIWINGQSMRASLQALKARVRDRLSEAQRAELDRVQSGEQQSCLAPAQSRIDLARYLESSLGHTGPWTCEVTPSQLDAGQAAGRYACRTSGGGRTQGTFSATYGPTRYTLELNGRGNAVDGRNGQAIGGGLEVEQRLLSNGRWVGERC
ncbi:DUF3617 domain-containing protein [Roseateles sp. BYS87W]|uniref:DUF3617 domain-containing protein n=1 Tax=Pelomonas baiyunensis TaxID=3299026 RepID=A0ABW7H2D7_9BURK